MKINSSSGQKKDGLVGRIRHGPERCVVGLNGKRYGDTPGGGRARQSRVIKSCSLSFPPLPIATRSGCCVVSRSGVRLGFFVGIAHSFPYVALIIPDLAYFLARERVIRRTSERVDFNLFTHDTLLSGVCDW